MIANPILFIEINQKINAKILITILSIKGL